MSAVILLSNVIYVIIKGREIKKFSLKKLKEEGGGWYASSATERKHVESISLVEGGQPSF